MSVVALIVAFVCVFVLVAWAVEQRNATPGHPIRFGEFLSSFGEVVGGLFGCVVAVILGLAALFFIIWLIKRMWEAA